MHEIYQLCTKKRVVRSIKTQKELGKVLRYRDVTKTAATTLSMVPRTPENTIGPSIYDITKLCTAQSEDSYR